MMKIAFFIFYCLCGYSMADVAENLSQGGNEQKMSVLLDLQRDIAFERNTIEITNEILDQVRELADSDLQGIKNLSYRILLQKENGAKRSELLGKGLMGDAAEIRVLVISSLTEEDLSDEAVIAKL